MNKRMKKLVLNRETVRALQDVDLRLVAGGMAHPGNHATQWCPPAMIAEADREKIDPLISHQGTCTCPVTVNV